MRLYCKSLYSTYFMLTTHSTHARVIFCKLKGFLFIFLTINHSVGLEDPGFVNTTPLYTFIQNLLNYNVYRQHGMQANFTKNLTPLVEVINLMSHIWMQNYYSLNVPVIIK